MIGAFSPDRALCGAIARTAMDGRPRAVINSAGDTAWQVEPDTKVDHRDITYPVIVHMRGGMLGEKDSAFIVGVSE